MLKFPDVFPAWMYRDPQTVADNLIDRLERDRRQAARRALADRNHKHLRIAALTRKAMNKCLTT